MTLIATIRPSGNRYYGRSHELQSESTPVGDDLHRGFHIGYETDAAVTESRLALIQPSFTIGPVEATVHSVRNQISALMARYSPVDEYEERFPLDLVVPLPPSSGHPVTLHLRNAGRVQPTVVIDDLFFDDADSRLE